MLMKPRSTVLIRVINYAKEKVTEKFCWYFLLFLLLISVFIDNGKAVVNFYRVWICIPILLCIRWRDATHFVNDRFVQLFLLLTLWLGISLFWSDSEKLHNMAAKILATLALLYMVFSLVRFQRQKLALAQWVYAFSGLVLIVAIYIKWGYIGQYYADNPYGTFVYYNVVAWFLAAAAIVSCSLIFEERRYARLLAGILFVLLTAAVVLFKSRGALLGLLAGSGLLIFWHLWNKFSFKKILFCIFASAGCVYLFYMGWGEQLGVDHYIRGSLQRADAGRFLIYQNAFEAITLSPKTILFGHGIAADPSNVIWDNFTASHWHSIYISTLFFGGITGLFFFLLCVFKRPYEIFIKRAKHNAWDFAVMGIMVTLLFDGNRIYEYPGGMLLAFTLPLFLANFVGSLDSGHQKLDSMASPARN